jgi:hypothetical protein
MEPQDLSPAFIEPQDLSPMLPQLLSPALALPQDLSAIFSSTFFFFPNRPIAFISKGIGQAEQTVCLRPNEIGAVFQG